MSEETDDEVDDEFKIDLPLDSLSEHSLGFAMPLHESSTRGRRKGLGGVFVIVREAIKQLCISSARYAVGKLEEPMTAVENAESQIRDRYAENRRRQERHEVEMQRLRIAVEKDKLDLAAQKALTDASELLKESAYEDMKSALGKLRDISVDVDLTAARYGRPANPNAEKLLWEIELSVRVRLVVKRANIKTLGELASLSYEEAAELPHIGETGLNELRHVLAAHGLHFAV